jgi:hypothetical protein
LADMKIVEANSRFTLENKDYSNGKTVELFRFEDIRCAVDERGVVTTSPSGAFRVKGFRVVNEASYPEIMSEVTARLLAKVGK